MKSNMYVTQTFFKHYISSINPNGKLVAVGNLCGRKRSRACGHLLYDHIRHGCCCRHLIARQNKCRRHFLLCLHFWFTCIWISICLFLCFINTFTSVCVFVSICVSIWPFLLADFAFNFYFFMVSKSKRRVKTHIFVDRPWKLGKELHCHAPLPVSVQGSLPAYSSQNMVWPNLYESGTLRM